MDGLEERTVITSRGMTYRYYISPSNDKDTQKPALLLHHGFPDGAELWKFIVPELSKLPNQLIIPDLLGYGGTTRSNDPWDYAYNLMTQDLVDLLDSEKIDKVISLGHDHGSGSASHFYNHAAHRTAGVILLNVAYIPPDKSKPWNLNESNARGEKAFGYPMLQYWYYFTSPSAAREMHANLDRLWEAAHPATFEGMRDLFGVKNALRKYVTDGSIPSIELRSYAYDEQLKADWKARMEAGGLEGPLCWYTSRVQGVQELSDRTIPDENLKINVPTLFVGCDEDAVCRKELINLPKQAGLIPDLTIETMKGIGHWPMYERPKELAELIVRFMKNKIL